MCNSSRIELTATHVQFDSVAQGTACHDDPAQPVAMLELHGGYYAKREKCQEKYPHTHKNTKYANQKDFPPDQRSVKEMRCGEAKGGFQFRETIRLAKRKIVREEPERFELSLKTNSQQDVNITVNTTVCLGRLPSSSKCSPQPQRLTPPELEKLEAYGGSGGEAWRHVLSVDASNHIAKAMSLGGDMRRLNRPHRGGCEKQCAFREAKQFP
eukprot:jgi/Bigna1/84611/fgenesh1_pg.174_\